MNDNNNNNNSVNGGDSSTSSSPPSLSFSKKLHSSLSNISCCFRRRNRRDRPDSVEHVNSTGSLLRCSSLWGRSRRAHPDAPALPEIKDKCRSIISRLSSANHRRRHSADFRYDPLSYSMNFDEGGGGGAAAGEEEIDEDEFPFKSFSSRLPLSPPRDEDEDDDVSDDDDDVESEPVSGLASRTSPAPRTTTEIVSANG